MGWFYSERETDYGTKIKHLHLINTHWTWGQYGFEWQMFCISADAVYGWLSQPELLTLMVHGHLRGDHAPGFYFEFTVLGLRLLVFECANLNHEEDDE